MNDPKPKSGSPAPDPKDRALTLWTDKFLLLIFGVVGVLVLVSLILPDVNGPRPVSPRTVCLNNLRSIGLALRSYHSEYGRFPPAYIADEHGKPMHSWRVLMLPYLDRAGVLRAYRFDEPWNGPNNRKLADEGRLIFNCPEDDPEPSMRTSYMVVVGPNTMFPGSKSTQLSDISDGGAETIMLVEVAGSDIHWMEPRDLPVEQAMRGINAAAGRSVSSKHSGGVNVVFADARTTFLSDKTDRDQLKAWFTINGGEQD